MAIRVIFQNSVTFIDFHIAIVRRELLPLIDINSESRTGAFLVHVYSNSLLQYTLVWKQYCSLLTLSGRTLTDGHGKEG